MELFSQSDRPEADASQPLQVQEHIPNAEVQAASDAVAEDQGEVPKAKRVKCVAGSRPVDEAKRVAIESMNRKGAMRSKACGHGYYVCASDNCSAECSIRNGTGEYVTTWKTEHRQGCTSVGKQPAHMQHTALKALMEMAPTKTRKEIQIHADVKALSGNAFGEYRLYKKIQRSRGSLPARVGSVEGLKEYIGDLKHRNIVEGDVFTGFRAWIHGVKAEVVVTEVGTAEVVHAPHIEADPDEWDADAPIPAPEAGSVDAMADAQETQAQAEGANPHVSLQEDEATDAEILDGDESVSQMPVSQDEPPKKDPEPRATASVSVLTSKSALWSMLQSGNATRHIDGTFEAAPRWSCLICVGFTHKQVYFPVAHVLSKSEGKKSFESAEHVLQIFEVLEEHARELGGEAGVAAWKDYLGCFMRDGGKGYAKAIRVYFTKCTQRMCFFHLMQAVWRRRHEFPRVYALVVETLRKLHLCVDVAEFALGVDVMLRHFANSLDGRKFVRYWRNTQYGIGCADGNWAFAFAGDVTTNNALEGYNGRMKDMVFGKGRMRRSAMWCLDRYVFAMSLVRDQIGTRIDGTEEVNMWTEWRHTQTAEAVNRSKREAVNLRHVMVQTHSVGESHKTLPKGLYIDETTFKRLAGKRATNLKAWLEYQDVRHTTTEACTCGTFLHHVICKHVVSMRVLLTDEITPPKATLCTTPGGPVKLEREGRVLFDTLDANAVAPKRAKK